jgi:hypothetical protein
MMVLIKVGHGYQFSHRIVSDSTQLASGHLFFMLERYAFSGVRQIEESGHGGDKFVAIGLIFDVNVADSLAYSGA